MLIENIGLPATLEQLAEECSELAQASLKYARYLRGENPTPKTEAEIRDNFAEEIADVTICIEDLLANDIRLATGKTEWKSEKLDRLEERFKEGD